MNGKDLQLLDAWRHDRISESEFYALQARLKTDAKLRAELRTLAEIEEGLSGLALAAANDPSIRTDSKTLSTAVSNRSSWLPWSIATVACVAAVVAVLALLWPGAALPHLDVANDKSAASEQDSGKSFCQLARTASVRWSDSALKIGDRLQARRVKLVEGTAEFDFDNGVRMVLTGPADIELHDAMHAWLHSGQVVFRVPPAAIGFTVETTEAAIVDLGTEFGVRAGDVGNSANREKNTAGGSSHGTELQVYEGEVIAEVKSGQGKSGQGKSGTEKQRLHGGQALRIGGESDGRTQPLPFWPERFIHELPDPTEHPDAPREGGRKTTPYNKTRHDSIHILPTPHEIVIDGSLDDWDLSGRFSSECEPPWGKFYNVHGAMMFDDEQLYIGAVVADPFPMRSTISPTVDRELYGGGGSVALRLSMDRRLGWPVRARGNNSPQPRELLTEDRNERLVFVVLWYFAVEELACLHLRYGMDFHGRLVNPPGYRGVWKKHVDGLGYTVEYAIPWSLLHAADDPPRRGDTLAASWLVHWSDSNGRDWKGQLIDIANPSETGWNFHNAATWGRAIYGRSKN